MATNTYQFLTPDNVVEVFKTSRQYTEQLTQNSFWEYERIARNKPHPSIPKEYPKTTDGTTASIIRKTPHRIIQQLPTGAVKANNTEDWLPVVAGFIYAHKIIPNANEGYALIQKCWSVIERFLTFGFCPTYTPFIEHAGNFTTDLRLPYWGDIFVQPGKLSDADSNYMFMRSWWQTKDIEALIASQNKLPQNLRTWDTKALNEVKDYVSTKESTAQTPVEREKAINTKGGVELITGFQRGMGAKFYTFHWPSNTVVRTKTNKDPRGELPVSFAYGDIDGSNPFGRSIIELVGGMQNLMDGEMQMYQYNRALQLNPPLLKKGAFSKNKIKFSPNVVIDLGSDPNADVKPLIVDTSSLANFPNNYGLMKSQLTQLLSSPDNAISAQAGNTNSKTPQGVNANLANLTVDDNYIRKQFERWFERWSETAINLYFAERTGVEELQLDDETADTLRSMDSFDQANLSEDNKIRINYSTATPALKFEVDASSSQVKNDPAQQQIAAGILDTVMKYPMLNSNYGGPIDVDELARKIVMNSDIEDPLDIAPEPTKAEKQAKLANKQQPNGFSPLFDKPKISIDYGDIEDPASRAAVLNLAGAPPSAPLNPNSPRVAENVARQSSQVIPQEQPLQALQPPPQVTPDHVLKADQQGHQQVMDQAKLQLEQDKLAQQQQVPEEPKKPKPKK